MGVLKKAAIPFLERSLGRPLHKPTVYFRVTPFCNLKCIICDDWKPEKHKERRLLENMLTKDEYIKIIDDLADFGVQRLQFGGGEPLVRKEIFDIINYAKSKGLPTRILTNGYLLSKMDVAKKLSEGIDEVWVSLDGPNPETHDLERGVKGCFENVVKGIENLNDIRFNGDRKFKIVVAAHISPMNMFDPEEYLNLLQKLKADSVLFTPVYSGHYGETLFNTGIKTAEDVRKVSEMVKRVKAVYCKSKIPIQTLFLSLNVALEYYRNPAILRKFKCYIGGYGLGFIE
ncbi:MAG: radical SAM protein, partial [Candidatus Aenigmarchaeota archaeon]|nr:radical SAM protein [Candidatus Aenigmarchaeota archaeon]